MVCFRNTLLSVLISNNLIKFFTLRFVLDLKEIYLLNLIPSLIEECISIISRICVLETPSRHLAAEELLISLADPIVVNLFHSFGRRHGILNPALLSGLWSSMLMRRRIINPLGTMALYVKVWISWMYPPGSGMRGYFDRLLLLL